MKENYSISIVMPALNEEKNIENAIKDSLAATIKMKIDGEIIVVNDGSDDNTELIIKKLMECNNNVKLINHKKPKGIGYSFFDGVRHATKDIVVMFPGDNENDPENAMSFLGLMDEVDIIVPFIHNVEVRKKLRRILSSIYRFIINMTFGINLNYTNGTVFYRRCLLENIQLQSYGFFYQAELLIKLIRKGYLFAEVPNLLSTRNVGKSKATTMKSLVKVISSYLKIVYEIHIKRIEGKRDYKRLDKNSITYVKYIKNIRNA